jgi:hypothetical protein
MFTGSDPSFDYFALSTSNTGHSPFRSLYVGTTGNITVVKPASGSAGTIVTGATAANPSVFTIGTHDITVNKVVLVRNAAGGTWSTINGNHYVVTAVGATTITLGALDASGLGSYTGSSATIAVTGEAVLFSNVPVGYSPIGGLRVNTVGTTASNFVGLR